MIEQESQHMVTYVELVVLLVIVGTLQNRRVKGSAVS